MLQPLNVIDQEEGYGWTAYNGDSCEVLTAIPDETVGFSVFSPPFASLYTYSNSERDLGNCKGDEEFFDHLYWILKEIFRVTMPGRCVSIHCMDYPAMKERDGYIGIKDFSGQLVQAMNGIGFIYSSRVTIWKCPVTQMQRTKSIALLHKQMVKDSTISRQGLPDYLLTFRKPGENSRPVAGKLDHWAGDPAAFQQSKNLSIDLWQKYASPVWMDINPSNTLQYRAAREQNDERHICPLQLDVIERALQLWSLPGDVVLSPFMGIGSEGFVSLKLHRKFIGVELKSSYFRQAVKNLRAAEQMAHENNSTLFDLDEEQEECFEADE